MKFSFIQLAITLSFLGLVGCATNPSQPKTRTPKTETAKPPAPREDQTKTSPSAQVKSVDLPSGEFAVLVESVPDGGTVVVNGIPVGRAPQRVVLPGSQHGFFRYDVSLKVRFIASDATHTSQTVEELMTPLDKIPAVVRFTPSGATRVAR